MAPLTELLGPDLLPPAYGEGSLTRLPPTVGRLLGVDAPWRAEPLAHPLLTERYERVVVLLLDGLGFELLRANAEAVGLTPLLQRYGQELGSPLTSVAPSTTAVATTVLAGTGAAPGELGFFGFSQYMPGPRLMANVLFWREATERGLGRSLEGSGYPARRALPTPTIHQLLGESGVHSHVFQPVDIVGSPLSRIQHAGAAVTGYAGWVDLLRLLGEHLEASVGRRGYTFAYVPDLDTLMHRDGPASPTVVPWLTEFLTALHRTLAGLSQRARRKTLLLITADHGHHAVPPSEASFLSRSRSVGRLLRLPMGGEPRHAYLYARRGQEDALLDACLVLFGDRFRVVRGSDALTAGLYGDPARLHPEAAQRVGDVVLLARGSSTLWHAPAPAGRSLPLGMHGSLTPAEMLVPLLTLPLQGA